MALLTLNLLPPRVKAARAQRMMMTIAVVVGIGLLSIPVTIYYYKWLAVSMLKSDFNKVEAEAKEYGDIIEKITELQNKEATLAKKLTSIDKLLGRQATWIRLLETMSICQSQVGDLWFTSIKSKPMSGVDAGKTEITLEGQAYSIDAVVDFQNLITKTDMPVEFGKTQMSPMNTGQDNQIVVKFLTTMKVKV